MNSEDERQYSEMMRERDSEWKYFAWSGFGKDQLFGLPCGSAVSRSRGHRAPEPEGQQRAVAEHRRATFRGGHCTALLHCHCHRADHHVEVPFPRADILGRR
jgi:hypothetical protein